MEPAILSGSDHYPALWAATLALSNDQEFKNAISPYMGILSVENYRISALAENGFFLNVYLKNANIIHF